jgi:hypothetical protein
MQISPQSLLASQQLGQAQAKSATGFTAALEKERGFAPLPLEQTAPLPEVRPEPQSLNLQGAAPPGSRIDIKV